MEYKAVIMDSQMKSISMNFLIAVIILAGTGCASSSINESIVAIEREDSITNNMGGNNAMLDKIQALRYSQKSNNSSYSFTYQLNKKELSNDNKLLIARLVGQKKNSVTINIALAKGVNKIDQLALSMERAKKLRMYVDHFDSEVTIKYSPSLLINTMTIVTGV